MRRSRKNDDDIYEDDGVTVRDGKSVEVHMTLMDSADGRFRITDAQGGSLGLHRPGYRIEAGGNEGDQLVRDGAANDRAEIYGLYDAEKSDEWRNPPTGFGSGNVRQFGPPREGDACMCEDPQNYRSPGTFQSRNGKLVCVPTRPKASDALTLDETYEQYDEDVSQAWRGHA